MDNNLYWDTNMADNLATPRDRDPSFANPENVSENSAYKDPETNEIKIGEMPSHPDLIVTLSVGESYNIQKGYHSGNTIIKVQNLKDSTLGTATENDIVFNRIAYVNGFRIIGKLDLNQNEMIATATADDLLINTTAWVNKKLITGNIPVFLREDKFLTAGESYIIPKGYHGGECIIKAKSLADQTQGTATEEDIALNKSAWVNGKVLVGRAKTLLDQLSDSTALAKDIRKNKIAYISFGRVLGEMLEFSKQPPKELLCGASFEIPEGHHDGLWVIKAASLISQTSATATSKDIRKGKNAWVDGILVDGELIQNFAPNTDGTATPNDIRKTKIAWVNGEQIIGTNPYDTINFNSIVENNTQPESPITILIPSHKWQCVRFIMVSIFSKDTNNKLYDFVYNDIESGSIIIENDNILDVLSIITSLGSPKITITSMIQNSYMKVIVNGYTVLD